MSNEQPKEKESLKGFSNIIQSVEEEFNKGVVPPAVAAEPRISNTGYQKQMDKQVERERKKDRLSGPSVSLGESWNEVFP
jgi:hypothetical protein